LLGAGAVVIVILAMWHPDDVSWAPTCLWREATGLDCPGCGTGRGVHHLLQGDPAAAWGLNPMMILLGIPAAAVVIFGEAVILCRGRRVRWPSLPVWVGWAIMLVLAAWWIGRNLLP